MAVPHSPSPSANLSAVAAFSQARAEQDNMLSDLNDPPPPSTLQPRPPSSRRTLTRALELAREAVQLDAANDNPEAAVKAYGHSVALLSEVMERVRRGEDSTDHRRRNGRRRSSTAQEEEVRRLQSIHDTYADRMNILSIIYSIPPIPYSTPSTYSDSIHSSSPTSTTPASDSPPADTSSFYPPPLPGSHVPPATRNPIDRHTGHDPEDPSEAIGSAMFEPMDPISDNSDIPGLPPTSSISHPYATAQSFDPVPQTAVTPPQQTTPSRSSILQRRSRAGSTALPPAPPPPSNALPPAPDVPAGLPEGLPPQPQSYFHAQLRPPGEAVGHRRTSSGNKLEALQEELERREDASGEATTHRQTHESTWNGAPVPPGPTPYPEDYDLTTPRNSVLHRPPPSPRANVIVPRPRGSSTLTTRSEIASQQTQLIINTSNPSGGAYPRRTKSSAPADSRSSSPAESMGSGSSGPVSRSAGSSVPGSSASSIIGMSRTRSTSQPGRPPILGNGSSPPEPLPPPPLPPSGPIHPIANGSSSTPRKSMFMSKAAALSVQTDSVSSTLLGLPTTPTSPLPPAPPSDSLRKPYYMMNLLRSTMESSTGGYVTRRLHVPQEVWSQGGAKLTNTLDKVRVVGILHQALEELSVSSSEYFGAGNVSSGLALGIGSIGKREAESWLAKLDEFSGVCEGVVANFGKKLGVGEGFVSKKSTWGDRVTRRFDKFTNGKNLDSPQAYTDGLKRLFRDAQLLDEHTKAVLTTPIAPAYTGFPVELRTAVENKLRRSSQFFASVILTFVIRDLSQLLDKYAKKCEKWLAE